MFVHSFEVNTLGSSEVLETDGFESWGRKFVFIFLSNVESAVKWSE
jgi:hypothetical protein